LVWVAQPKLLCGRLAKSAFEAEGIARARLNARQEGQQAILLEPGDPRLVGVEVDRVAVLGAVDLEALG
jgi:hypothetical protein